MKLWNTETDCSALKMDHNMTGMMDMVIHFREREIILFSFWKTGTISEMAVSMFISFLLCVLYEAIKGFRLFLAITHMKPRLNVSASQSPLTDSGGDNVPQDSISFSPMIHGTGLTRRVFSGHRMVQAILVKVSVVMGHNPPEYDLTSRSVANRSKETSSSRRSKFAEMLKYWY
ncbi:hypothetical protein RB195_019125 [Necator americanus]|uniref:Copper transport protein n=1 Tax=Necator americanus TaxID=51031 RepID=A0ABR1CCQ4_NECAM